MSPRTHLGHEYPTNLGHAVVFAAWPVGNLLVSYYTRKFLPGQGVEYGLAISLILPLPVLFYILRRESIAIRIVFPIGIQLLCASWFVLSITSTSPVTSGVYAALTTLSFGVASLYVYAFSQKDIAAGLGIYALCGSAFIAYLGLTGGILEFAGRSAGIETFNPNATGFFAMTSCCFAAAIRDRILRIATVALCLAILYATNSRASMVGVIVFWGANQLFLLRDSHDARPYAIVIMSLWLIALLFPDVLLRGIRDVLSIDDPARGLGSGFTGRTDQWRDSARYIGTYWLYGAGFRTCGSQLIGMVLDNGYITYLIEMGIVGSCIAVWLLVKCVALSISNLDDELNRYLFFFAIAYLVHSVFERFIFNIGNPGSLMFIVWLIYSLRLQSRACLIPGRKRDDWRRQAVRGMPGSCHSSRTCRGARDV